MSWNLCIATVRQKLKLQVKTESDCIVEGLLPPCAQDRASQERLGCSWGGNIAMSDLGELAKWKLDEHWV
jgi:hypothetical protein